MILRGLALVASLAMAAAALAFALGWRSAVPRLECEWSQDFCSDYGVLYGGLALVCLVFSLVFFFAFRAGKRK